MAGTLTVGQLATGHDVTPIIWMNASLLAATAGATALLPNATTRSRAHPAPPPGLAGARGLLKRRGFRVIVIVSALVYGSHAMHDAFAVIWWSHAGIDTSLISVLWSEAVAAEVLVFVIGPALIRRFGVRAAATLAAAAGIIRWTVAATTTSVLLLSLVQPLHGLTFALLHLACMRMMADNVPANSAATAQALYAFGSGCVTAALTLLSGALYARYGGVSFLPMAMLCATALPFAWFGFPARSPKSELPAFRH
ncbi:MFS transporter [Bradyrhizobium sp.]|uniref:MFS transporter n=1 Tax=Bradyrhizobium sp. TaxID=376 RepID=UPI0025B89B81|nr:MFS transporter [Bradyrhizobium sp.]